MSAIASQITSLAMGYLIVYSDADQRKHQSYASLAFVWGIHRAPVNSPHEWPVTRKMVPFDDVIILLHFTTTSTLLPAAWVQQVHSRMFWCINILQLFEVIFFQRSLPNIVEIRNTMNKEAECITLLSKLSFRGLKFVSVIFPTDKTGFEKSPWASFINMD